MSYKKSKYWIIVVVVAACIVVTVSYLTNSRQRISYTKIIHKSYSSASNYAFENGVEIKKNKAEIILNDNEITVLFSVIGKDMQIRVNNTISNGKIEKQTTILEHKVSSSDELIQAELSLDTAVSAAIISHNRSDASADRLCLEAHTILANENHMVAGTNEIDTAIVYGMSLYQEYADGNYSVAVKDVFRVVALTYNVENENYTLKEYWEPGDGAYHDLDLMVKFPKVVAEELAGPSDYYMEQMNLLYNECNTKAASAADDAS